MPIHPLAGKPASLDRLVDVDRLPREFSDRTPDRRSLGTGRVRYNVDKLYRRELPRPGSPAPHPGGCTGCCSTCVGGGQAVDRLPGNSDESRPASRSEIDDLHAMVAVEITSAWAADQNGEVSRELVLSSVLLHVGGP